MSGSFSVDATGTANYAVPLEVVQGSGGFQPQLALTYSSGSGNGQLGVGFALAGLSSIARCAKTIADDSIVRGVQLNKDDNFCFNGLKLVAVQGVYGAHGTEYRTLPDTHVKVISHGGTPQTTGPAFFEVLTPDGIMQFYGGDPFGASDPVTIGAGSATKHLGWPITSARDRSGNRIAYLYAKRTGATGEMERWLDTISYGQATNQDRRVRFTYENRPDTFFGYVYGARQESVRRLKTVTMEKRVDSAWLRARSYTLAYSVEVSTRFSLLRSVTACGTLPTECKQPTTFQWQDGDGGFFAAVKQSVPLPSSATSRVLTLDLNGDNRTDYAYPETNTSSSPGNTVWKYVLSLPFPGVPLNHYAYAVNAQTNNLGLTASAYPFDYDLDGQDDLLSRSPANSFWAPLLSRGTSGGWIRATTDFLGPTNQTQSGAGAVFGDFDGDGLQDVLEARYDQNQNTWRWWRRMRTGKISTSIDNAIAPHDNLAFVANNDRVEIFYPAPEKLLVLDVNGDGRDEVLFVATWSGTTQKVVSSSPMTPIGSPGQQDTGLPIGIFGWDIKPIDLNGDGLTDLMTDGTSGNTLSSAQLAYWLNTGKGFTPMILAGITRSPAEFRAAQVMDVDGDGRQELLVPRASGTHFVGLDVIKTSIGSSGTLSFAKTPIATFDAALTNGDWQQSLRIGDANGDGLDDILVFLRGGTTPAGVYLFRHVGSKPGLLTGIHEQYAADSYVPPTIAISYATVTDSDVYQRGACPRLEWRSCALGTQVVVKSTRLDSGLNTSVGLQPSVADAQIVSQYRYKTGRLDRSTRSFAGFAERLITTYASKGDPGTISTRSFYDNTHLGRSATLTEEWTYTNLPGNRQALQRSNFSWVSYTTAAGKSYYEYIKQSVARGYEFPSSSMNCNGQGHCLAYWTPPQFDVQGKVPFQTTTETVNTIDQYGNETMRTTTYGGATAQDKTEVSVTPDIDAARWLVRRPKQEIVTDTTFDALASATRSATRTTTFAYPGIGEASLDPTKPKQIKRFATATTPGKTLTYDLAYDTAGNLLRIGATDSTTAQRREATFAYDPHGYPHAQRNALGHTTYTGFDPVTGMLKIVVDANDLRTDRTYDSLGHLVKSIQPGGVEQRLAYALQPVGSELLRQIEASDATGAKIQRVLDRAGRPLIERFRGFDGMMREATFAYDPHGRLATAKTYKRQNSSDGADTISYAYDNWNRLVKQTEPSSNVGTAVRTWQYDALQTTSIDTRSTTKQTTNDQRGRTVSAVDGLGTSVVARRLYGYGAFDLLATTQIDGLPQSRSMFAYDAFGDLVHSIDGERGSASYKSTAFGEMMYRKDATGIETTLVYDALGRLEVKNVSYNFARRSVTNYSYDSVAGRTWRGALLQAELTDFEANAQKNTTDYDFDALGRLRSTSYTLPSDINPTTTETFRVTRSYDTYSRLSAITYPRLPGQIEGTQVRYEYAPAATSNGQLQRIRAAESGKLLDTLWELKATDVQNRQAETESGDGVRTLHDYNWRGQPMTAKVVTNDLDDASNLILSDLRFAYDGEGNLVSRKDARQSVTETFAYDPLSRLSTSSMTSDIPLKLPDDRFTYDVLGNLVSSTSRGTFTYDANRPTLLTSVTGGTIAMGTRTYAYDASGRQIVRPEGKVQYNDFDLPARYTTSEGVVTDSFMYTAAGERARKITRTTTVTYVPDLYERHRTANTVEHRLLVPGAGATLRYLERTNVLLKQPTLYAHTDHLGSTTLLTQNNAASGFMTAVVERRSYDPFGQPRNADWKSPDVFGGIERPLLDQGYTGHIEDREHDLVNMKGRIYDPKIGRFLTPDPNVVGANATQRWNRYSYVSNNPLSKTDPLGFEECADCSFIEQWPGGGSGGQTTPSGTEPFPEQDHDGTPTVVDQVPGEQDHDGTPTVTDHDPSGGDGGQNGPVGGGSGGGVGCGGYCSGGGSSGEGGGSTHGDGPNPQKKSSYQKQQEKKRKEHEQAAKAKAEADRAAREALKRAQFLKSLEGRFDVSGAARGTTGFVWAIPILIIAGEAAADALLITAVAGVGGVVIIQASQHKEPLALGKGGKAKGPIPNSVPKDWTEEQLEETAEVLEESIKNRTAEQDSLGRDTPAGQSHQTRISDEVRFLKQVERALGRR